MTPGLQKLNIPKTQQSVKTVASKGISAQARATGDESRSTVGRLSQSSTMSLFGINAQRSGSVWTNVKAGYSARISSLRHSLNDNRANFAMMPPPPPKSGQVYDNGMSDIQKLMAYQMLLKGGTDVAMGVADGIKTIKDAKAANKAKEAEGKGNVGRSEVQDIPSPDSDEIKLSDNVTASLNGMKNAKDADTLSTYISSAETNLSTVEAEYSTTSTELKDLESKTAGLKSASDQLSAELKSVQEQIPAKDQLVKSLELSVPQKERAYNSAKSAYDTAAAQNPQPANIGQLKAQMDSAMAAWEEEDKKLENAMQELKELQDKEADLKPKAEQAKNDYDTNISDIKTKSSDLKRLEKEKNALKKGIEDAKKDLAKMQKGNKPENTDNDK